MAGTRKLGKPTDQRLALVSNLASDLLWYGHIETTFDRAKSAAKLAEEILTLAVNTYTDVANVEKTTLDNNGKEKKVSVSKDGVKKLNARRKMISLLYEQSGIMEMLKTENFSTLSFDYFDGEDLERFQNCVENCRNYVGLFEHDFYICNILI